MDIMLLCLCILIGLCGVMTYVIINLYRKHTLLEKFVAKFHFFVLQILNDTKAIDSKGLFEGNKETGYLWEDLKEIVRQIERFK